MDKSDVRYAENYVSDLGQTGPAGDLPRARHLLAAGAGDECRFITDGFLALLATILVVRR